MANGYFRGHIIDSYGRPISSVSVAVDLTGTSTDATLYSDRAGTSLANPFTNEVDGSFEFWASTTDYYDVTFTKGGVTFDNTDYVNIEVSAATKSIAYLSEAETITGSWTFQAQLASTLSTGTAPFSVVSTTKVTNLNADAVDDYSAGNASGNVPISNGTVNTNLNADMVDGSHASAFAGSGHTHDYTTTFVEGDYTAGNSSGNVPLSNGTVNTNLNAEQHNGL